MKKTSAKKLAGIKELKPKMAKTKKKEKVKKAVEVKKHYSAYNECKVSGNVIDGIQIYCLESEIKLTNRDYWWCYEDAQESIEGIEFEEIRDKNGRLVYFPPS